MIVNVNTPLQPQVRTAQAQATPQSAVVPTPAALGPDQLTLTRSGYGLLGWSADAARTKTAITRAERAMTTFQARSAELAQAIAALPQALVPLDAAALQAIRQDLAGLKAAAQSDPALSRRLGALDQQMAYAANSGAGLSYGQLGGLMQQASDAAQPAIARAAQPGAGIEAALLRLFDGVASQVAALPRSPEAAQASAALQAATVAAADVAAKEVKVAHAAATEVKNMAGNAVVGASVGTVVGGVAAGVALALAAPVGVVALIGLSVAAVGGALWFMFGPGPG